VLARLAEMDRQSLRDLLRASWQFVASGAKCRGKSRVVAIAHNSHNPNLRN
jgi:hypothetical protein